MITQLVAFGCSYIEGNGLEDPHNQNVAACVANNLGLELDNWGIGGSGLEDHVRQFRLWSEQCQHKEKCLVLFGLSDSYRVSFPSLDGKLVRPMPAYIDDPENFLSKWPQFGPDWKFFLDFWFRNFDIDAMARHRYWWVTNLVANMCGRLDIPCAMFHVWRAPDGESPFQTVLDVPDMITWSHRPDNCHMLLPCGHTNAEANQIYSQLLTKEIHERKLV